MRYPPGAFCSTLLGHLSVATAVNELGSQMRRKRLVIVHKIDFEPGNIVIMSTQATMSEERPTTTTSTQVGKRRLTFAPQTQVLYIDDLGKYTEQEIDDSWYKPDEYRAMMKSRQQMISGEVDRMDSDYCALGTSTQVELTERRRRIHEARMAVFHEQTLQWEEDVYDAELLADVYFDVSCHSQLLALDRADDLVADLVTQLKLEQAIRQQKRARDSMNKTKNNKQKPPHFGSSSQASMAIQVTRVNRASSVFVA